MWFRSDRRFATWAEERGACALALPIGNKAHCDDGKPKGHLVAQEGFVFGRDFSRQYRAADFANGN